MGDSFDMLGTQTLRYRINVVSSRPYYGFDTAPRRGTDVVAAAQYSRNCCRRHTRKPGHVGERDTPLARQAV